MNMATSSSLGRDFWFYRLGQLGSTLGDACNKIALAWWILSATGSATAMATILAPVMFAQLVLIPLFGPIGDRFQRKRIAIIGDAARFVTTAILGFMAMTGSFHLVAIIAVSLVHAVASALFTSVSQSIIPQLVHETQLETAIHRDQVIAPIGTIVGGVTGGAIVATLGPASAFLIDAGTFLIAALATATIAATPKSRTPRSYGVAVWFGELKQGVRVVTHIPIELGVALLAGFLNLALAPFDIALAYFVKEAQHQPAWQLALLETSISVGAILGAMTLARMQRRVRKSNLIFIGIAVSGVVTMTLPWTSGTVLPSIALLVFGVCVILSNVPLKAQTTVAMPDEFRSRAVAVRTFIAAIAVPIGVAVTGVLIERLGLRTTLLVSGGAVLALSFALFWIPRYREFFDASAKDAARFYKENYATAFSPRAREQEPVLADEGAAP